MDGMSVKYVGSHNGLMGKTVGTPERFKSSPIRKLKEGIRIGATELKNSGTQKRHGGI